MYFVAFLTWLKTLSFEKVPSLKIKNYRSEPDICTLRLFLICVCLIILDRYIVVKLLVLALVFLSGDQDV